MPIEHPQGSKFQGYNLQYVFNNPVRWVLSLHYPYIIDETGLRVLTGTVLKSHSRKWKIYLVCLTQESSLIIFLPSDPSFAVPGLLVSE